jgi:hypothetical protein
LKTELPPFTYERNKTKHMIVWCLKDYTFDSAQKISAKFMKIIFLEKSNAKQFKTKNFTLTERKFV